MNTLIFYPNKCQPPSYCNHAFDGRELKPGNNFLNDAELGKLLLHPDMPLYLEWGAVEVIRTQSVPDDGGDIITNDVTSSDEITLQNPAEASPNLKAFTASDAQTVIGNTHQIEILERWLGAEDRITVRRALNARIQQIREGRE